MRLIIIIPKIFITIITTISLTTMKRKIIFTNIINQNQIESTYKECMRDKLDDRTTTCLTVRCQCLNDGLYITPVVPTGVFYALFIVEIVILKEIFYENTWKLLKLDGKIYIRLDNSETAKRFLRNAEREGFLMQSGKNRQSVNRIIFTVYFTIKLSNRQVVGLPV